MEQISRPPDSRDDMVLSYHRVRTALGLLGFVLPVSLIIGALLTEGRIQPSISDFYHTTLRDIFVGTLCAIGIFLISYKGYRRKTGEWVSDDIVATMAGISAFGVALFPNETENQAVASITQQMLGIQIAPLFHYASALVFFSCLSVFCYFKFAKAARVPWRRKVYLGCGHVILLATAAVFVFSYLKVKGSGPTRAMVLDYNLVFWAEAIGVWAFAVSWLVKGKADLMFATRRASPA